jgi:pimeloyl-ACP methyl ester carboxylesterase
VSPLTQPNLAAVGQEIARLADGTATRRASEPAQELIPLPIYIQCADNVNDTDSFAHAERLRALSRIVAPDVRQGAYDVAMLCVNPPTPATNPQRPLHAPGVPPVLVLNSRYDASTPYQGARRVAGQLDGSTLVTYDGLGHGAATRTDCTSDLVYRYLTERQLPPHGTHCPAAE